MELRSVDRQLQGHQSQGRPAEWICSGVPTAQPAPERMTADLLGERGLLLFPDEPVDTAESPPRSRSRRLIGYVTRDPELIHLAVMLAKVLDADGDHAMIVAARWIQGGYTADAALRRATAAVRPPNPVHKYS